MNELGPRVCVRAFEYRQGYRVLFFFDNGTEREIDLEPYLHGTIFEPLKDPVKFRTAKIEGNTIAWDNGADIDPDVLYYNLKPAWCEETMPLKTKIL
jgi:hypothetical protein